MVRGYGYGHRPDVQDLSHGCGIRCTAWIPFRHTADGPVFPAFLYIYVDDAECVYRRALAAGAVSVEEPWDTPYGDRRAMVREVFGNLYQIANARRGIGSGWDPHR